MSAPPDSPKVDAALRRLMLDAATGEAVRAMRVQGLRPILLRGPAIARWLYPEDKRREYIDVDLLVAPNQFEAAANVLVGLGYSRLLPADRTDDIADDPLSHAVTFCREHRRPASVDLHYKLFWVAVDADTVWALLSYGTEQIEVGHTTVEVLRVPARALLLPLHAAQHGRDAGKPLSDLKRAVARLDDSTWRDAAELARRLGATDAFAAGLRLDADGAALAQRLELSSAASPTLRLMIRGQAPIALAIEQLLAERSALRRARLLWAKLVPSPAYIRLCYPTARRGRLALVCCYAWRWLRLIRYTPRALSAWRAAHRE